MALTYSITPAPTGNGDAAAAGHGPRVRVEGKVFARGGRTLRVHGVTYGPFPPDEQGDPFPSPRRVREDFTLMQAAGINALRTYHTPPDWLLEQASASGLAVFLDVPWPKHLCFLDSLQAQRQAREFVARAARRGRGHASLLAYSIGNEVPPNIIRWHGARRVERFLAELCDVARQTDPDALVTYANYPPTEYLDLSFLDFATFNVYLHDRETFRRYLFRLQNLVGDKPLLLGEIGMDTFRHGEQAQANFLADHLREVLLTGLAGAFVFAWTDEWHTGGYLIEDWAFGLTRADRTPKAAYHAVSAVFGRTPAEQLTQRPRVSVVVCTYNGGQTLEQCLHSLRNLDYPDYDVIVVDDGSTDNSGEILARFPEVRAIRQSNHGLSHARNVGVHAATGSIVAYTDSDCFADPDWLSLLVEQLRRSGAAAVGGPNLSPEDGWLAACVAASPGQPAHVLESDQVAEHIPGCNMAFRRDALLAINGFDNQYKKAGDDVDVCWRLQQAGMWITFAPGAFVWHHRRQTPRAYLKQQAGYGEAEALLRFKHPDKFNGYGHGKWRGVLYGASLRGVRLGGPIIYRGTFGTGLFQCIYQREPAHWAMLPATLEWHFGAALVALVALFWAPAGLAAAAMLGLSLLVAVLQAAQARLAPQHDRLRSRCVIAALCYLQPLVRSWARYRTRLAAPQPIRDDTEIGGDPCPRLRLSGARTLAYWSEEGCQRTELLDRAITYLVDRRWSRVVDSGWSNWDLEIFCHPWTTVRVCTAQEDHGGGKHLIRIRYRLHLSRSTRTLGVLAAVAAGGAAWLSSWMLAVESLVLLGICTLGWWRGVRHGSRAVAVFDRLARKLGLLLCEPALERKLAGPATPEAATAPHRSICADLPEPLLAPANGAVRTELAEGVS